MEPTVIFMISADVFDHLFEVAGSARTTAHQRLSAFHAKWPGVVDSLITTRLPIDKVKEPLSGSVGGIKSVISVT